MIEARLRGIAQQIDRCMLVDADRLRARLQRLTQTPRNRAPPGRRSSRPDTLADLERDLAAAMRRADQRMAALPRPTYPLDLPVVKMRRQIADAIAAHQVVVLCGDTGSGKTTQLPKICLELGRGARGLIGHTQPRRIAARAVASRLASELHSPVGHTVGFKIRFADVLSDNTYVKLMTDGILLAEIPHDRRLLRYDTLIIDEAHERSLNIDFLLGYVRSLLPRRPDLKLIITSATIDPERFSKHFDNAPIIQVEGRTYPVELRYRPLKAQDDDEQDMEMLEGVHRAIDELSAAGPGDILAFFPTERDIRAAAEHLRKHLRAGTQLLPLYARLSAEEQMRVFAPHPGRRIVLATNVAETSLTVPGIRYVVDTGLARMSRYSPRSRVQRLPVEPIAQASADQRKGRCGREAPGICIRLYDESDHNRRPRYADPEILRTNLAGVILHMMSMELGEIEQFPFLDPPDRRAIRDGYDMLVELGALDSGGRLTPIGRDLARLPIDPRLGRMILASIREGCLADVLIIAAALAVQDPRDRPMDQAAAADAAHAQWKDESSDFVSLMNLWQWYHEQARHHSQNQMRRVCRDHFLSFVRMREWLEVHRQLNQIIRAGGIDRTSTPAQPPPGDEAAGWLLAEE